MPPSISVVTGSNNNTTTNGSGSNGQNGSGGGNGRPSDGRRQRLLNEVTVPIVSNFFPIERYYDAAQKVYDMVLDTYECEMYDDCYLYGKRYCIFCLDAIPNHHYYNSTRDNNKYKKYKIQHTKQVANVIDILEKVALIMDQQELVRQEQELVKQEQERIEKERLEQLKFDELERRIQLQKQGSTRTSSSNRNVVAQSALSKLALLSQPTASLVQPDPDATSLSSSSNNKKQDPSGSTSRYRLDLGNDDDNNDDSHNNNKPITTNGGLPPPPSYHSVASATSSSGLSSKKEMMKKRLIPMREIQDQCKQQYIQCQQSGRIQMISLDTYQGRNYESTNGCTVISALVAAEHLQCSNSLGITNATINKIIDVTCGPILKSIRSKLGLNGQALIIPSDVHDYLVDEQILQQNQFVGVAGGNVCNINHMNEFLKLIAYGNSTNPTSTTTTISAPVQTPNYNKASATFFFREHVISIIKIPVFTPGCTPTIHYDFVDSLPHNGGNGIGRATRTRCYDYESLLIFIQYYTSQKLNNYQYMDHNPWDDSMADIDPRVFQGFVWMTNTQ